MSLYHQGITLKALLENPDLLNVPKGNKDGKKDGELSDIDLFAGQSAFLGPTLWDKTLPVDVSDFKLEYMDLDEFLNENELDGNPRVSHHHHPHPQHTGGSPVSEHQQHQHNAPSSPNIPSVEQDLPHNHILQSQPSPLHTPPPQQQQQQQGTAESLQNLTTPTVLPPDICENASSPPRRTNSVDIDFEVSDSDLPLVKIPGQEFDPKKRQFSEEELRPQPMIKKSKKIFVPEDLKDDKYWCRRKKNNVAAKRSRDARRIKENQISMRAAFLEKENSTLRKELDHVQAENKQLIKRLAKYEPETVA